MSHISGNVFLRSCFFLGCRPPAGNTPLPSECYSCKYAKNGQDCVLECPSGMVPNKNKKCSRKCLNFYETIFFELFLTCTVCYQHLEIELINIYYFLY